MTSDPKARSKATASQRRRQFAEAYAGDPTSPTFRNAVRSITHVFKLWGKDLKMASARNMAPRYLEHEETQKFINAVMKDHRVGTGMSGSEYVQRCLDREDQLVIRGGKGDAAAAVAYAKLAGTALGYLVQKHEDVTPPERKPLTAESLLIIAERLKRLSEPNPLPMLHAPAEDAEYVVEDAGPVVDLTIETGEGPQD